MRETRALVERVVERGDVVYGLTTGVGARKKVRVPPEEIPAFNRRPHREPPHRTPGPMRRREIVRATMLRHREHPREGHRRRPARDRRAHRATRSTTASSHGCGMLGSLGQADLPPTADLAHGLFADADLQAKEGLALLNSNAFSTGIAALAVADCRAPRGRAGRRRRARSRGLRREPHPAPSGHRGRSSLPGTRASPRAASRPARRQLPLGATGAARNLQDPLTFRCLPQMHGASATRLTSPEAARDRAQRLAGEPARHPGRRPDRLGGELRRPPSCRRPRLPPHRARAGCSRAPASGCEAPPGPADRPPRRARAAAGPGGELPRRVRGSRPGL